MRLQNVVIDAQTGEILHEDPLVSARTGAQSPSAGSYARWSDQWEKIHGPRPYGSQIAPDGQSYREKAYLEWLRAIENPKPRNRARPRHLLDVSLRNVEKIDAKKPPTRSEIGEIRKRKA